MATVQLLEDYVHCHVCYELFQSPEHEPLILQCLHTVCEECVDKLKSASKKHKIKCPLCNEVTAGKDLKVDFRAKSLVEGYKRQQQRRLQNSGEAEIGHQVCEVCKTSGTVLTTECIDCKLSMCKECEKAHLGFPTLTQHRVAEMEMDKVTSNDNIPLDKTNQEDVKLTNTVSQMSLLVPTVETNGSSGSMRRLSQCFPIEPDSNGMDVLDFSATYFKAASIEVQARVKRMFLIGDEIWVSTDKGIKIFSDSCNFIRTIEVPYACDLKALVPTANGNLVAAYWENRGLQLLNMFGQKICTISKGSFCDVVLYNEHIYAILRKPGSLLIFANNQGGVAYRKVKTLKLSSCSDYDTLGVQNNKIFLCSWFSDCLFVYNHLGIQLSRYGGYSKDISSSKPGILHEPRLCHVDACNNILIADCNGLQVCNDLGEFRYIDFGNDVIGKPQDAVPSHKHWIWILAYMPSQKKKASHSTATLTKYRKVMEG